MSKTKTKSNYTVTLNVITCNKRKETVEFFKMLMSYYDGSDFEITKLKANKQKQNRK